MALKKTMTLVNNFSGNSVFPDAYIKVDVVYASKSSITAVIGIYEVAGGRSLKRDEHLFEPDLDGPNFIKQAYEHLKTLPEFAGAADV